MLVFKSSRSNGYVQTRKHKNDNSKLSPWSTPIRRVHDTPCGAIRFSSSPKQKLQRSSGTALRYSLFTIHRWTKRGVMVGLGAVHDAAGGRSQRTATDLPVGLPPCLPTCPPTCLKACLPTCLPTYLPTNHIREGS